MKLNICLSLALFLTIAVTSCKKSSPAQPSDTTNTPINGVNVYAVGFMVSPADTNHLIAAIWKNGALSTLSTKPSEAHGIAKSGTDIYVAGFYRNTTNQACYWKNGNLVPLESTSDVIYSEGRGIAVQGNDVYVIGNVYTSTSGFAAYWKNGVFHKLPIPDTDTRSYASGITMVGADVFIVGYSSAIYGYACYWKNGILQSLSPTFSSISPAGIAVNNNNIYIIGSTGVGVNGPNYLSERKAYYLKNDNRTELIGTTQAASAKAITFIDNDQYIAGSTIREFNVSRVGYWKNGVFNGPVAEISDATCIATQGTDVYVGGIYSTLSTIQGFNYFRAAYWKNGVITKLTPTQPAGIFDMLVFVK